MMLAGWFGFVSFFSLPFVVASAAVFCLINAQLAFELA